MKYKKNLIQVILGIGFCVMFASIAMGSTVQEILQNLNSHPDFNIDNIEFITAETDEKLSILEKEATQITNNQNVRTSVKTTTSIITSRLSSIISPKSNYVSGNKTQSVGSINSEYWLGAPMGLSAGDEAQKYGIWCNLSVTSTENDREETESDATLGMGILGADYRLSPKVLTGIALSYENNDQDTLFNNGHIDQDGITLIPYIAYLISEMASVDFTAGYAWLSVDQDRNNGPVSSYDSERWFVSANLNGYYNINEKTNLTGTVGYTHSKEDQDGKSFNPEETTELGTLSFGTEIAYLATEKVETYANFGYSYDTTYEKVSTLEYDDNAFNLGVGMRVMARNDLSFDFSLSTELGRDDQDQFTGMFNVRYEF